MRIQRSLRLVIFAALAVALFVEIFRFKIYVPFVDDWLLIPWGTHQENFKFARLMQMLNGHQHVLLKIYTWILGSVTALNLFYANVTAAILGILGYGLLYWSETPVEGSLPAWLAAAESVALGAVLLNWRQMQNFTMLICLPWMMAIFVIGLFSWCWTRLSLRGEYFFATLCVVLVAPFTNAMGLVVPLFVISAVSILFFTEARRPWAGPLLLAAVVSIYLSFIFPVISAWVDKPHGVVSSRGSLVAALHAPLDALLFFLVTYGNVFSKWNDSALPGAVTIGLSLWLILALSWRAKNHATRNLDSSLSAFLTYPSLGMGIWFAFIFFAARFGGLGLSGGLEARYSSGSALAVFGVMSFSLRRAPSRKYRLGFAGVFLGLGLMSAINGVRIGDSTIREKNLSSRRIQECFRAHRQANYQLSDPCVKMINPGAWLDQSAFLSWLNAMATRRLSIFTDSL